MKSLKIMRIVLSVIFLLASCAYILTRQSASPVGALAYRVQILPSILAATIGVTLFWLLITFLFGRIYCSTVCPLGALQDVFSRGWRLVSKRPGYRFKKARRYRYDLLLIYAVCLVCSVMVVPLLIEPWNIFESIVLLIEPGEEHKRWAEFFLNSSVGMIIGAISLAVIAVMSATRGRMFCKEVCPIGTALSLEARYSLWHIEIDPDKCVSCMECEEVCKSQCIKVVSRYVDDKECVRCFNCLTVCRHDAIRLQRNRNRAATPMMRKVNQSLGK